MEDAEVDQTSEKEGTISGPHKCEEQKLKVDVRENLDSAKMDFLGRDCLSRH